MVALLEKGVTDATRAADQALRTMRSSQSLATSASLLSRMTSLVSLRAMPRLTVPTKPRFSSFSSSTRRGSWAAFSRSHAVTAGSGLASLMAISLNAARYCGA